FFFQAEDGIRDRNVTGVQTCALPISIAGRLSQADLMLLGKLVLAVMREDFEELTNTVIRAGWSTAPIDAVKFERAIRRMIQPMLSQPLDELEFALLCLRFFVTRGGFLLKAPWHFILRFRPLVSLKACDRA